MRRRIVNFFNSIKDTLFRILFSLAGALFIALATIVLLAPESVRDFIEDINIIVRIVALLVLYAIAGLIVYQEFVLGGKPAVKGLVVKGEGGSVTALETESVRQRIVDTVQKLSGVESTSAVVKAVRGKAEIDLKVVMQHDSVNIPDKQREITKALNQLIEKQLGIRMSERPKIEISFKGGSTVPTSPSTIPQTTSKPVTPTRDVARPVVPPPAPVSTEPPKTETSAADVSEPVDILNVEKDEADDDPEFWNFLKSNSEPDKDTSENG